jgi:hypothetical protein
VNANSAYWADTRNDVTFEKNVTIQGNLTALGTSTFKNTIFSTTSALSVVNLGPGPALYVFQAAGASDVASFYDGDGIEVLHVGNAQGGGNPLGQVGINTSDPSAELTVNGAISSNRTITVLDGNSNQWNSNYTTSNANSAKWSAAYTSFNSNSGKYDSNYTTTNTNSAAWSNWSSVSASYALGSRYVKLSGDTMTGALSTTVLSADSIFLKGVTRITSSNDTNVFIGDASTGGNTLTGTHNYIFGRFTGTQLTSSSNNFFAGLSAGGALKQINNNVFMGRGIAAGASYLRESNYSTLPAVCKVDNNFAAGNQAGFSMGQRSKNNRYQCYDGCGFPYFQYTQYCHASKNNILIGYKAGFGVGPKACNNTFLGYRAGGNLTCVGNARHNTFIGYKAGAGFSRPYSNSNTFIGSCAGYSITYGGYNTFIGYKAGADNTSGSRNNFIGRYAGRFNTAGSSNNFLGYRAGLCNTSGSGNNFLGSQSGFRNTTGNYNNFLGCNAGSNNTSGTRNNFIGYAAGGRNTTGSENIFLGSRTGYNNTAGGCNIFIGGCSGQNSCGSRNIFIGPGIGSNDSIGGNNILIGSNNNFSNNTLSGVIVLGIGAFASANNTLNLGSVSTPLSTVRATTLTNQVSSLVVFLNGTSVRIPILSGP